MCLEVDVPVREHIGEAVTGAVDGEHAMSLGQPGQDRYPLERPVAAPVHEEQGRPAPELEHLCLTV